MTDCTAPRHDEPEQATVSAPRDCVMPCDPDCEVGPVHCWNWHRPSHKPDWHDPAKCDDEPKPAVASGAITEDGKP